MAAPPDPEDLARRFLDLWQAQSAGPWREPALVEAMGRFFTALTAPGAAPDLGGQTEAKTDDGGNPDRARAAGGAPGTEAAAGPSRGGAGGLDELRARLDAMEARLAALEDRPRGGGGGAGKRRPRRSD